MRNYIFILACCVMISACRKIEKKQNITAAITEATVASAMKAVSEKKPGSIDTAIAGQGVRHAASLWRSTDGTPEEFIQFCADNFIADPAKREAIFARYSEYFESLYGHFNKLTLDMQENVQLQKGEVLPIDPLFAGYNPGAHLINDLYDNKIAFNVALNFPYYTTEEKNQLGTAWSPLEWGYARLGDVFSSRIPSDLVQLSSKVAAETDAYIADYNIYMGHLLNKDNKKLFPENMVLLSHWNLRDEIKANYANKEVGYEKQGLIYRVMQRIVDQSIPKAVINSGKADWNPITNDILVAGAKTESPAETDGRYQQISKYLPCLSGHR